MRLSPDTNVRGSFIAFYGANNLGKSTQLKRLISRIAEFGHQSFMVIKYPVYELYPTGPRINEILRNNPRNGIDPKSIEMQKLCVENRMDFQPILIELLNAGIDVICEDYVGTGIAWGMTWGLNSNDLENLNFGLIRPDYEILIDGERFSSGIEKRHVYESSGNKIWEKNRQSFLFLANKYGWKIFNANQEIDLLHEQIWNYVKSSFKYLYKNGNH